MRRTLYTKTPNKVICDINLTNLIDVTMVILIVYILIAPLVDQGIDIKLPEASPHTIKQRDALTINISKTGETYIGRKMASIAEIKKYAGQKKYNGIIIKADEDTSYGSVIRVLDELNNAGISNVGMATRMKE